MKELRVYFRVPGTHPASMRRERLKDQIEEPRVSVFDSIVRAVVILISLGAVYYALSGRTLPFTRNPADISRAIVESRLIVTATGDQRFYWNKEGPIPLADFGPRLASWLKTVQAPQVRIAADESARLGDTINLLNEARRQGVTDVRIETRTRPTP